MDALIVIDMQRGLLDGGPKLDLAGMVGDAHTVGDRPHMNAAAVIAHHNWLWANLTPSRSVAVADAAELIPR